MILHKKLIRCFQFVTIALLTAPSCALDADEGAGVQTHKHQITGLFAPERVADLREVTLTLPDIELVSVDFESAEATFRYDAAKVFNNPKGGEHVERFNNLLLGASHQLFGVKPLRSTPLEKLELIEIKVVGLDCQGCSLGAYDSIFRLDGVERATASFKQGRVTALIDAAKTNRAMLETALEQRGVQLVK